MLQLEAVLDRKPGQLSGGQRQRVAMGRAIIRRPAVFLMDEPLSNLDAKLRVQMRAEISRLQRGFRTTTIYVTHDQVEAMTMGDRVAVLNGGEIEQCDTPRDLYDHPANLFVAAFIGSPSMNFFPATVELHAGGLVATMCGVTVPLDRSALIEHIDSWVGRDITIGVRAESVTASPTAEGSPRLNGTVEFVEELGSEVIVHTRVVGLVQSAEIIETLAAASDQHELVDTPTNLVTKLPAHSTCRPGDSIALYIDPSAVHCFDPTGPSLRRRSRPTGSPT
ncbi:MAG: putative sugar transporter, ATP-binding protein [Ilumatobacteraceae bacterium]|nr:putative sugar transporter, ATP-binding protein [Ilumatobacteraceae bacterium]